MAPIVPLNRLRFGDHVIQQNFEDVRHDRGQLAPSYPNNVTIAKDEGGLTFESILLGGQVRAISKSRLLRMRGTLSSNIMQQIDRALRITLDL